jgi:hypothetical protein
MADRLATIAMQEYVGKGNTELILARDSPRVWYAYTQEKGGKKMRITGKIRQMLKYHIQFLHYGKYMETTQASHIRGQNLHQVIDQSLLRKIWKPPVSCNKITHMVRLIKSLAGIMATETVLTRRNHGTSINGKGTAICKLCGIAEETNLHMLCECTGNTELVTERRLWIRKMRCVIRDNLSKHMNTAQLEALLSLWNVDELGKINEWVSDDRCNLEVPGIDPILLQLRVLIDKQNGVDNHMYGITTTAWRAFLEDFLNISPSIALTFQVELHRCTQSAIDKMWKARNLARHGMTTPSELWELRIFEATIRSWKSEAARKGRVLLDGAEERIRALPRKQKLTWVHNRIKNQKGIKEFWSTVPARVDGDVGRELELEAVLEPGSVGQLPPDLPNKVQIRVVREQIRKQSHLEQYFIGGNSSRDTNQTASKATNAPATGLGPSRKIKKRLASGDLRTKASPTRIAQMKNPRADASKRTNELAGREVDHFSLEAPQTQTENQADESPQAGAVASQLTLIREISETDRALIARNKAEAIKKKKSREEGERVAYETHKKQKSKKNGKSKKRKIGVTEVEEQTGPSKRQKPNGKKRDIMEVEKAEQADSSKRGKSEGQDGCKQLGCSTHKGIS